MRVKKYLAFIFAAILATTMLTACPWEKEEDKTDDASSVPVTSTDTSQDDDNTSGNEDEEEKDPTPPEVTNNNSGQNGTVAIGTPTYDKDTKTFSVTFTTEPAEKYTVTSATATVATSSQNITVTWPEQSTFARTMAVRADTKLSLTTSDNGKTFALTGIPINATSCNITVEFKDPGYTIENDTYMVYNADGLKAFADAVNGSKTGLNCTLTSNIALTGEWTPIGNSYSNAYAGTFDGDGHTISGLQVSGGDCVGLFGYVNGGTVKNLNLVVTSVSGSSNVGSVVGRNYDGTIQGCMVTGGSIKANGRAAVGGVVGYNGIGSITDCYWKKGPEQGVGTDYGTGTPDVTQINDDVPMQTAIAAMNNYLTGYQYELKGDQIVLVASSNTPEVSGLTQKVLDAARAFGL